MRLPTVLSSSLLALALSVTATAQLCSPFSIGPTPGSGFPTGQCGLAGIFPQCASALPPLCNGRPCPGNPNFGVSAYGPAPLAAGLPMVLVFVVPVQFGVALPPGLLDPTFGPGNCRPTGHPDILAGGYIAAAAPPGGVTGPAPSAPVPLPLPPGLPPGLPLVGVHTAALQPGGVALTEAIGIGWLN